MNIVPNIAGQATALFDKMTSGNDRIGRWVFSVGGEEVIKRTQGRQSPVDGGDGVALRLTVGDVGVYIADGDGCERLVGPSKELLEIIAVVNVGAGMRAFAAQPLGEFLDLDVHLLPPDS